MFVNTGSKLQLAAAIYLIGGIIISFIYGIIVLSESVAGVLVILIGAFSSWVAALIINGIGEIIDALGQANTNTYGIYRELQKFQQNTKEEN